MKRGTDLPLRKQVGGFIRKLRKKRKLTGACLARHSNTTQQHISLIERGSGLHTRTLGVVLKALSINATEFDELLRIFIGTDDLSKQSSKNNRAKAFRHADLFGLSD